MQAFAALGDMTDQEQVRKYRDSLIEYCKLDTYAMVRILNNLKVLIK
jgi:hypothetical protein